MLETRIFLFILQWVSFLTWGLLDTLIGVVFFIISSPWIRCIKMKGNNIVVKLTNNRSNSGWGFEGGAFIFSNTNAIFDDNDFFCHEWGHCNPQTWICGPLHIFLSTIPSIIRFWYREWAIKHKKSLPSYDSIWFEGTATRWGKYWYHELKEEDLFLFDS